jgi:hypothetical protein
MPEAAEDHSTLITRRTLLAAAAAAVPIAAASSPLDPDAELFAAAEAAERAGADHDALYEMLERTARDPFCEPGYIASQERMRLTGFRFARTPARTVRGLALKLRHIVQDVTEGKTHWADDLVLGALADAQRMAGEA